MGEGQGNSGTSLHRRLLTLSMGQGAALGDLGWGEAMAVGSDTHSSPRKAEVSKGRWGRAYYGLAARGDNALMMQTRLNPPIIPLTEAHKPQPG